MMRIIIVLAGFLLLGGCVSNPSKSKVFPPPTDYVYLKDITIKSAFNKVKLTKINLASEINGCVSTANVDDNSLRNLAKNIDRPNDIVSHAHRSSSKRFIHRNGTGLCLEHSENKYPIYAAESFFRTANPVGVLTELENSWYKRIAMKIAVTGRAKIVYATNIGTAYIVSYWSGPDVSHQLHYSYEFRKKDEWKASEADYTFSHPTLQGFSVTRRGGKGGMMVKSFPAADG